MERDIPAVPGVDLRFKELLILQAPGLYSQSRQWLHVFRDSNSREAWAPEQITVRH